MVKAVQVRIKAETLKWLKLYQIKHEKKTLNSALVKLINDFQSFKKQNKEKRIEKEGETGEGGDTW